MTPLCVAGVDLSMTSTGLALVYGGGQLAEWRVKRVESKGLATATLAERAARLARLRDAICGWVSEADLLVIEGPSFGQASQGGQHDRAGLWWLVVDDLIAHGLPVAEVSPKGRAKYGTGTGNAKKDDVLAAAVRRYLDVPIQGNDIADAVLLASMGCRHLDRPVEKSLPVAHLAAMDAVRWPQVTLDVMPAGGRL